MKLKLKMTDGGEGWAPVDNDGDQDPADDLGEPKEKMMKKELNEKLENGTMNSEKQVRVHRTTRTSVPASTLRPDASFLILNKD